MLEEVIDRTMIMRGIPTSIGWYQNNANNSTDFVGASDVPVSSALVLQGRTATVLLRSALKV